MNKAEEEATKCSLGAKAQALEQEISNLISRAAHLEKENEALQMK